MPELGIFPGQPVKLEPLRAAFPHWQNLPGQASDGLAPDAHGDMPRWRAALARLPNLSVRHRSLGDMVTVDGPATPEQRTALKDALLALHPWRKGPFSLFGVDIDTEWRSDWKWQRVRPHLAPLAGRRVLDVGCGNGYFGWRMLEAGADLVLGIDPTLVFCLQHQAVNRYMASDQNWVLPLRFEALPEPDQVGGFDTVFSMGVIYHRRDPEAHARALFQHTRPGGQVVLESLLIENGGPLLPSGRYARMRNVPVIPDANRMLDWLSAAGFLEPQIVDVTPTSVDEQRSTAWMTFESLAEALDPENPDLTVEGHPRPVRAIAVARKGV